MHGAFPITQTLLRHNPFYRSSSDPLSSSCSSPLPPIGKQETGAYQPTRDTSGAQLAVLQRTTDAVVAHFLGATTADTGCPASSASAATASAPPASCDDSHHLGPLLVSCAAAMCALLDLDHRCGKGVKGTVQPMLMPPPPRTADMVSRTAVSTHSVLLPKTSSSGACLQSVRCSHFMFVTVVRLPTPPVPLFIANRTVQPHLNNVWSLLWKTAAASAPPAPPEAMTRSLRRTDSSNGDGVAVAAAAACRLVLAYRELRQLEFLLRSLAAAMKEASAIRAPSDGGGGGGAQPLLLPGACAAVVRHPLLLRALHQAVLHIPPGEYCPCLPPLHPAPHW